MSTKKLSFSKEVTSPFGLLWLLEDGEDRGLQTIFIPYEDAQFLASDLKGIFPISDYVFPEHNDFDWTGLNVFGSQETLELMACLREKSGTDEEIRFIHALLLWLEQGMETGSDLMIEGTL